GSLIKLTNVDELDALEGFAALDSVELIVARKKLGVLACGSEGPSTQYHNLLSIDCDWYRETVQARVTREIESFGSGNRIALGGAAIGRAAGRMFRRDSHRAANA